MEKIKKLSVEIKKIITDNFLLCYGDGKCGADGGRNGKCCRIAFYK
jgi:hypothetical protein